jgi:phage terminase large subunit
MNADWGFANDPTVLVKCWIDAKLKRLLVEYKAWGVGVELDDISALFASVPGSREHVIRADSARSETISHVRQHGFLRIEPAE